MASPPPDAHGTIPDATLQEWVLHEGNVPPGEIQRVVAWQQQQVQVGRSVSLATAFVECDVLPQDQIDRITRGFQAARAMQIPGYEVVGFLGAGAMAMVLKARQLRLDRTVAIKVLPKKLSDDPDYVNRFRAEGKAAAKLNHPNIVQAIDVIEAAGRHYFIMEYVRGHSLDDELANGKVFSEADALDVIIQVARALEHAHSHGIIHRDVKPGNIMLTDDGIAKLSDMGLARQAGDARGILAEQGKTIGSPNYISPEQIYGQQEIDFRADIYSLGCTLYHMVTGRLPFKAETPREIMKMHLQEPLTPPDHINDSLSAGLGEVVETMMAKRPDARYASTADLLLDLDAVRRGERPQLARKPMTAEALGALSEAEAASAAMATSVEPAEASADWRTTALIVLAAVLALSVILNLVLLLK